MQEDKVNDMNSLEGILSKGVKAKVYKFLFLIQFFE
jgi:hypothetical protein